MFSKRLLFLILVTSVVVFGTIFDTSREPASVFKITITTFGLFLIILASALIGIEASIFFTFKSSLGKSLLFISLGLLSWGVGALLWFYYFLTSVLVVPYPSLGDIFFLATIPLAGCGLFLLLRSIKLKCDINTIFKIVIPPLVVFVVTFWLLIQSKLAENASFIVKSLDVIYPVGDSIFLSLALIIIGLSYGSFLFKPFVVMAVGFIIEVAADFLFSYTTAVGTYYQGNFVDIVFALAFFTIGLGMFYVRNSIKG